MKNAQAPIWTDGAMGQADIELERRAEEAARLAGKTVEEWLHDVILEKSQYQQPSVFSRGPVQENPAASADSGPQNALFKTLADRVRMLERALGPESVPVAATAPDTSHAGTQRNYDEDARALIEGIRARTQQKPPYPQSNGLSRPQNERRLSDILAAISRLEDQIAQKSKIQVTEESSLMAEPHIARRFTQLEQQLLNLETHLATDQNQERATALNRHSEEKTRPVTGRKAFQKAIETIADRRNNANNQAIRYIPKDRSSRVRASDSDTGMQYSELMRKIDKIQNEKPDIAAIEALKVEFAALRNDLLKADDGGTLQEIRRLREIVQKIEQQLPAKEHGAALALLEADINRIAEFLLKSPDLSHIPEQVATINREISRLSDGLLAIGSKNDHNVRENADFVVHRLEEGLQALRGDIIDHLQNTPASASLPASLADEFETRLATLYGQIAALNDNVSGHMAQFGAHFAALSAKMDGMEQRGVTMEALNASTAELHQLRHQLYAISDKTETGQRDGHDQVVARLQESLNRLRDDVVAEFRQTATSSTSGRSAIASDMSAQFDQLRGHIDHAVHGLSGQVVKVENRIYSATERLEELGRIRAGEPDFSEKMAQMELRLVEAAKRLETASQKAAQTKSDLSGSQFDWPIDALTREDLKTELDILASRIDATRQEWGRQDPISNMVTSDQLKHELDILAARLDEKMHKVPSVDDSAISGRLKNEFASLTRHLHDSLAGERSSMMNHIDHALDKLQRLADEKHAELANLLQKPEAETSRKDGRSPSADFTNIGQESRASAAGMHLDDELETLALSAHAITVETPARTEEEIILQRMRDHVKARRPDEPVIEPSEADIPLAPGSGKPDSTHFSFQEESGHRTPFEPAFTPNQPPRYEEDKKQAYQDADLDHERMNTSHKSKADFIAAARRAAQAASIEHSGHEEEGERTARSALAAIRERINAVTRIGKSKNQADKTLPAPRTALVEPHFDDEQKITRNDAPAAEDTLAQAEDEEAVSTSFTDELDAQKRFGGVRTRLMTTALAAALVAAGYLVLKEPVETLVAALYEPSQAAQKISQRPLKAEQQPSTIPPLVKPEPEARIAQNIANDSKKVQEDQNFEGILEKNEEASLASAPILTPEEGAIDYATTQSISPAPGQISPLSEKSRLDTALIKGLEDLPRNGISKKLADALQNEDPLAMLEVARRYGQGDIFARDLQKSAFWYEQAAKREQPVAQFRLGTLYEEGIGVAKDAANARNWYMRAAENGNANAMHNLAVLYTEGAFGNPDFSQAFAWFEKGAAYGVKDSQFNLGILYVRGLGVEASLPQAYKWFDIVARSGDVDAAEKRDEVAKALPEAELASIRQESGKWQKTEWLDTANVLVNAPEYWQDGTETSGAAALKSAPSGPAASSLVKEGQQLLNALGFDAGEADGLLGSRTKEAVRSFEYELGLPQTGKITKSLLELLKSQKI